MSLYSILRASERVRFLTHIERLINPASIIQESNIKKKGEVPVKASYTSSLRPHTLVAEGLIH
jgi:hypothetical protein